MRDFLESLIMPPEWATGFCDDWAVGAQLLTKDGRRVGNAVIAWVVDRGTHTDWTILTTEDV